MKRRKNKRRRELMKTIGTSTVVGGFGLTGISGTATARIAADPDGSIEDSSWDEFESYTNSQASTSSINPSEIAGPGEYNLPNPKSFSFDTCGVQPDGDKMCVSTFSVGEEEYEDCAGRTLAKFGFKAAQQTLATDGSYNVEWSIRCWIGIDSSNCIWAGVGNDLDECSRVVCPDYPDSLVTIASVKSQVWDISRGIVDEYRRKTGYPAAGSQAETALIALVAAVVFLAVFAPPPGVPG